MHGLNTAPRNRMHRSLKTQLSAEKERDKDNSNLEQTIKQLRNDLDMRSKQLDTRQALNDELSQQMSREKSLTKRLHQDVYKEQNKLIELQRLYTMRDTMLKVRLSTRLLFSILQCVLCNEFSILECWFYL